MNATPSVVPILLGGLPLAVLYSVLLVNVRQRFGGIGIVVSAVVAVLMTLVLSHRKHSKPSAITRCWSLLLLPFCSWRCSEHPRSSFGERGNRIHPLSPSKCYMGCWRSMGVWFSGGSSESF